WWLAGCEIIRGMNGLAPTTKVTWSDQGLSAWNLEADAAFFGSARPAITRPRVLHLDYTHSADTAQGQATSIASLPPAIQISLLRCGPVDGQTIAPRLELTFLGDGEGRCFGLTLPPPWEGQCADRAYERRPTLYWWAPGEFASREVLAIYEGTGLQGSYGWAEPVAQQLQVEQIDDYLRVRLPGADEEWIVPTGDYPLTRGCVRASWYGESGMINVSRLRPTEWVYYRWVTLADGRQILQWRETAATGYTGAYPFAIPREPHTIPEWMNGDAGVVDYTVGTVGDQPPGWTVTANEVTGNRPMIHFVGAGGDNRAILYILKEIRRADRITLAAAPTTIYPDKVTWHRDNSWRGANFTAEIKDFAEAITLRPYHRAELKVCWDTGVGTPAPATRIIGYLDGTKTERDGGKFSGFPVPTLRAQDHPTTKLDKKFMRHMPSFELWTAAEIFQFVVEGAGVRDGLINIDPLVTSAYVLPKGSPPWEPAFGYEHDYGVIQALDIMLVDRLGLQWGRNSTGYFLRPRPTWTTGDTPDWTLDLNETDPDEITLRLVATENSSAWRNYVMRLTGARDTAQGALWADSDTLTDPTNAHYAGDDLWDIEGGAESTSLASYMAYRRLKELRQYEICIEHDCQKLDLAPDMFVEVNCGLSRVPDGSVFRILEEDGEAEGVRAEMTYTMGLEELGT
ncbi:MAG TPA: hypothetical protein VM389_05970, partial [Phycisphaerae bacterium]|nr:hypothetical protein [Phycisphaerae bacterium]